MKTCMKPTILAAALVFGLSATCAVQAATASEQRAVAGFSKIELDGPYDVVIEAQGKHGVTLSGPKDKLAGIDTVVHGDTLTVRARSRFGLYISSATKIDRVTIAISAPALSSLKTNGSGVVALNRLSADQFSVSASGPGDLRANG